MLKALCKYIEDNLPQFQRGTTLQEGHRIENAPDRCVTIIHVGGTTNKDSYFLQNYNIRILCRSTSHYESLNDANTLKNFFHTRFNVTLPDVEEDTGYIFEMSQILNPPNFFNIDDSKRYEYDMNLMLLIYKYP